MAIFSINTTVTNGYDPKEEFYPSKERRKIVKLFGITFYDKKYKRDTDKVEMPVGDKKGGIGFKS